MFVRQTLLERGKENDDAYVRSRRLAKRGKLVRQDRGIDDDATALQGEVAREGQLVAQDHGIQIDLLAVPATAVLRQHLMEQVVHMQEDRADYYLMDLGRERRLASCTWTGDQDDVCAHAIILRGEASRTTPPP
jgi:hypothetical protein